MTSGVLTSTFMIQDSYPNAFNSERGLQFGYIV